MLGKTIKIVLRIVATAFISFNAMAQTNPTPWDLSVASFVFANFSNSSQTTYPASMQGWSGPQVLNSASAPTGTQATGNEPISLNLTPTISALTNRGVQGVGLKRNADNTPGSPFALVVAINTLGQPSVNISWDGSTFYDNASANCVIQLQYRVGTSGNWTDITGHAFAMTPSPTSFGPTALPAAALNQAVVQLRWVYYHQSLFTTGDGGAISNISIVGSVPPVAGYCSAAGNGCTPPNNNNDITRVVVQGDNAGINNSTSCEPSGYGDYTSQNSLMRVNVPYTFTIDANNGAYALGQVSIWVDWNDNKNFNDAGENVFTGSASGGLVTGTITPPANIGVKRMRIRSASTSSPLPPCGYVNIGEVEDYTINVVCDTVTVFRDTSICSGNPSKVRLSRTPTGASIQWQDSTAGVWSNIAGATAATYNTPAFTITKYYRVLLTIGTCVQATNKVTTTVIPYPSLSITPASPVAICNGQSVSLTASGATTYTWSPPTGLNSTTTATVIASPPNTVTYTVTGSNSGCNTTATIVVTVNAKPIASAGGNKLICNGGSVAIGGSPTASGGSGSGYIYTWTLGTGLSATTVANPMASPAVNSTYTINVTDGNGCTATPATMVVTVSPNVTPSNSITGTPNPVCSGQSISFTATPTNGGSTPVYQWKNGGINIGGATSSTYSSSGLANGDIITCELTSNAACASPTVVLSNSVAVSPNVTPSNSIMGTPNPVCSGQSISFTATPTNGGSTPVYQWKKGGINIGGATSSTYSSSGLANGDIITCELTSNAACASPTVVLSNPVTVTVSGLLTPAVNIAITSGSNPTCVGSSVTFTATPTNGGTTPAYQWKVNGSNAGTGSTFSTTTLANNDIITCVLTSNASCASPTTATSAGITMTINPSITPSVSIAITAGYNPTTAGATVTFTATPTNGGASPAYQWKVNGANAGTNSSTYTTTTLANNDVITCIMTSNASCISAATATSNSITITYVGSVTPAVTIAITSGSNPLCAGESITFTATPTNGGTSPIYQWKINGSSAGTNSPTFSYSFFANNDVVNCVMKSSIATASPSTATSSSQTVTVNPNPVVSFSGLGASYCNNAGAVTLTGSPAGGVFSGGGMIGSVFSPSSIPAGDVVISYTYTDINGCTGSMSKTVKIKPVPAVSFTTNKPSNIICQGDSVTITASVGDAWSWSYSNSAGALPKRIYSNYHTQSITAIDSGLYKVTISLAGCTTTGGIHLYPNASPEAVITANKSTNNICKGEVVTLTAKHIPDVTYKWTDGTTGESMTTMLDGLYNVTVTGKNGCSRVSNTDTITLRNASIPRLNIIAVRNTAICEGESALLVANASDVKSYKWSTGETSQLILANYTSPFSVTITDSKGCTNESSVSVRVKLRPLATLTTTGVAICVGQTTKLKVVGPSGNQYTYKWNQLSTIDSIYVGQSGKYMVNVADTNGCSIDLVKYIEVSSPTVTIEADKIKFCYGSKAFLNAKTDGITYKWSTTETSQAIFVNKKGLNTYKVTVSDAKGCTTSNSIGITGYNKINTQRTSTKSAVGDTACYNEAITLSCSPTFKTYLWSNGSGVSTALVNPTTSGYYYLSVVDSFGCTAKDSIFIGIQPLPTPKIINNIPPVVCQTDSLTLTTTNGYRTYYWMPSGVTGKQYVTVIADTLITLRVTDKYNCAGFISTHIKIKPNKVTIVGPSKVCNKGTILLWAKPMPDSTLAVDRYQWSTGESTKYINLTSTGKIVIQVQLTFANGCIGKASSIIDTTKAPERDLTFDGPTTFCDGKSLKLTAKPGTGTSYTYKWNDPNKTATPSLTINKSGFYKVTITAGGNGNCPKAVSDSVQVVVLKNPTVPAIKDSLYTPGSTRVTLKLVKDSTEYVKFQWKDNTIDVSGAIFKKFTPTATGTYSLIVMNSNGCKSTSNDKYVEVKSTNGINSFTVDNHIIAYPNPFEGQVTFGFDLTKAETVSIEIIDITGRLVYKAPEMAFESGINAYVYDGSMLSAGTYIARIKAGKEIKTFKLNKN